MTQHTDDLSRQSDYAQGVAGDQPGMRLRGLDDLHRLAGFGQTRTSSQQGRGNGAPKGSLRGRRKPTINQRYGDKSFRG